MLKFKYNQARKATLENILATDNLGRGFVRSKKKREWGSFRHLLIPLKISRQMPDS